MRNWLNEGPALDYIPSMLKSGFEQRLTSPNPNSLTLLPHAVTQIKKPPISYVLEICHVTSLGLTGQAGVWCRISIYSVICEPNQITSIC